MARAAGWRIITPICGARPRRLTGRPRACGRWAARGSARICGNITCSPATKNYLEQNLSRHERRGAILPRHAGGRPDEPLARDLSFAFAGKHASRRPYQHLRRADDGPGNSARPVRQLHPGLGNSRRGPGIPRAGRHRPRAPRAACRSARRDSFRNGCRTGTWQAPEIHHRHVSHLYGLVSQRPD